MIHRIEIENFYSIATRQVIDLRVARNVPEDPDRLIRPMEALDDRFPAVVALFGANASGKTNVLRAFSFLRWWTTHSFQAPPDGTFPLLPFYGEGRRENLVSIAVEFGARENPLDDRDDALVCPYVYEVDLDWRINRVVREVLRQRPTKVLSGKIGHPRRVFERTEDGRVRGSDIFQLQGFSQALEKVLRPNASVISTLAQLQHPVALRFWNSVQWIYSNVFIDRIEGNADDATKFYRRNPKYLDALSQEIRRFDLGISDVSVGGVQGQPTARFTHDGLDADMSLRFESSGTQRFFHLFPAVMQTLEMGGIAVIDELDADIHPMILPEIVGWFHDRARNPHRAQLWFSCHNPSILESLLKEEIYFTEKDDGGRTSVYALSDIKGVRRVDNFYRQYLGGVYGAVPIIG